jgi:hypothetical protein
LKTETQKNQSGARAQYRPDHHQTPCLYL